MAKIPGIHDRTTTPLHEATISEQDIPVSREPVATPPALSTEGESPMQKQELCAEAVTPKKSAPEKVTSERGPTETAASLLPTPPPSPQQGSQCRRPTAQDSTIEDLQGIVATLKGRLQLDDQFCGAQTQKNKPCRKLTLEKNTEKVFASLAAISSLSQASPELEVELEELGRLVHCHHHRCGQPLISRVYAWIDLFPKKQDGSKSSAQIAREIRKSLGHVSTQCMGATQRKDRCKKPIGGQKVHNCKNSIAEVLKPETLANAVLMKFFLRVLEVNRYCNIHVNQQSSETVEQWALDISHIQDQTPNEVSQYDVNDTHEQGANQAVICVSTVVGSSTSAAHLDAVVDGNATVSVTAVSLSTRTAQVDPAEYWPIATDATPLTIVWKLNDSHKPWFPDLGDERSRSLNQMDRREGYIYAYEVEGNPGLIKIGYTSRSIAIRHEEWGFECNRKIQPIYPLQSVPSLVPCVRWIEALCHAELDYCRVGIYCGGCEKQHNEWFDTSAETVIATIGKNIAWVMKKLYGELEPHVGARQYMAVGRLRYDRNGVANSDRGRVVD